MSAEELPLETTFVFYRTYKESDDGYLMKDVFWIFVCVLTAYLGFVLKFGPAFMKDRKPMQLKNTLLVYNAIQVVLSLIIAVLSLRPLLAAGIIPKKAPQTDPTIRKMIVWASQAFYLGKYTELLDTIFFVLRKKNNQISFLHVYHHSSVIVGSWLITRFGLSQSAVWGSFMNASVHVVMYFYYFMAALGPQYQKYLFWKKYITTFQLVQFATVFSHQTLSLIYTAGEHSIVGILYIYFSSTVFFSLFYHFYRSTYTKKISKVGEIQTNRFAKEESKVH